MKPRSRVAKAAGFLLLVSLSSSVCATLITNGDGENHRGEPEKLPPHASVTRNVPEPAGYALLALGIIGLGLARHRAT